MKFETNLQRHKGSRRPPLAGDIFGMEMPGKGWLFGRVVRTGVIGSGDGAKGELLIYIYDVLQESPRPIPTLDKRKLLIPPQIVLNHAWRDGLFVTLENRQPRPGDFFERHCFEGHERWRYVDEFERPVKERFEPCSIAGLTMEKAIDDYVSEALGMKPAPERLVPVKRRRRNVAALAGPGAVTLHLPGASGEAFDTAEFEDVLRKAVEKAGAGTWQGHGHDLARGRFDSTFEGANAAKLIQALRESVSQLRDRLPEGWHATLRSGAGEEERIDL